MRTIPRYVLMEVLQLFLLMVVSLTGLMMFGFILKEALEKGLGLGPFLRLVPYALPKALLFAVPATILFAVTSVFGRLSAAGEIVAIKAAGISPTGLLAPVGVLAVILSLVTFWLNDVAFSWSEQGIKRVALDAVEEIIYSVLSTKRSFTSTSPPKYSLNVKRVDGRKLINPTFTFEGGADSPGGTVTAAEAEIRSNPGTGVLLVIFRDGTVESGGVSFEFSDTLEREIRLFDPNEDPHTGESPSRMPLSILPERTRLQLQLVARLEQQTAAATASALMTGDFQRLTNGNAWRRAADLEQARSNLYRMRMEPPRRLANGFSCLCFVLVGAPLAIMRRHSEMFATFFVCFGPILLAYYPLLMYSVNQAKIGAWPPVSVWLGNVVLAAWGFWMLRRVYRY